MGSFGYADDLTLIAPSSEATRRMLRCCEAFAREYDVLFNASKSLHLFFPKSQSAATVPNLSLDGVEIPIKNQATLLGSCIGSRNTDANFSKAVSDLTFRTNILLARFGFCSSTMLTSLFKTYCTSFYGSPLWPLDTNSLTRLNISWKRCLKRIWKVNTRTHSILLPLISCTHPLQHILLCRFAKFCINSMNSPNEITKHLLSIATQSHSIVGQNIRNLLGSLCLHDFTDIATTIEKLHSSYSESINIDTICVASAIAELCAMRDSKDYSFFDRAELSIFIDSLCIS